MLNALVHKTCIFRVCSQENLNEDKPTFFVSDRTVSVLHAFSDYHIKMIAASHGFLSMAPWHGFSNYYFACFYLNELFLAIV